MKVTVVTISFNQAEFLEDAILSVINQGYEGIEYIVVDAGSADGSRDIIRKYKDKIDRIIFESDDGPADGLNKGFAHATGDIYGFLNADDYFLPGALSLVAAAFSSKPDKDVLSGHALIVDSTGLEINRLYSRRFSLGSCVYGASVIAQQSTFFRAESFRKTGGFNEKNKIAWDGELWVDLALGGAKFGHIPEFLSAFRMYDDSITGSGKFRKAHSQYLEDMFIKVKERKRDWRDLFPKIMYKAIEYLTHFDVAIQRLRSGPVVIKKSI